MAKTHTFTAIDARLFSCVQATAKAEHGARFEPPNASRGTSTTETLLGPVVLDFHHDDKARTVTYTIKDKPFLVRASAIWSGIGATIEKCRRR